jgi:AhpD family alkylhydroperoxidase
MFLNEKAESSFNSFTKEAYTGGVLDQKTMELVGVAASCLADCPRCIRHHSQAAIDAGATAEEIRAVNAVAMAILAGSKRVKYAEVLDEALEQKK